MNSLSMTAKLSRKYVAGDRAHTLYLLVDLEALDAKPAEGRLPLNLGFVIDRSGSMSGAKLDYTKQAVQYAAGHLTPTDTASLTVYDDNVEVLYPAKPVAFKDELKGIASRIFPGGSTNLSGGMMQGYKEVKKNVRDNQVNRVLLLTDGLANVGVVEPEKLAAKAAGMHEAGVAVTTLGVGDDFDEDLLTAIAEKSGGNYYFIDSTDHIPAIFAQELQALLSVVAQNVKLQFHAADNVRVTKVWNYKPEGDKILTVGLPDIVAADRKIIVMELKCAAKKTGLLELGQVTLSYDDTGEKLESTELGLTIQVDVTGDPVLLDTPEEAEVMVQVELSQTAEDREEAIRRADARDFHGAASIINDKIDKIRCQMSAAPPAMQEMLQKELESLKESQTFFSAENYNAKSRKQMSFRNYQRRSNKPQ